MTADDVARRFTDLTAGDEGLFRQMLGTVLDHQQREGDVYRRFHESIGESSGPAYLPVAAFRLSTVSTFPISESEAVFHSSGTTGEPARHYVRDLDIYRRAVTTHFASVFGPGPFMFIAHLPSYEDGGSNSSLVTMARILARSVGADGSGLFLEASDIRAAVDSAAHSGLPVVLLGAAFGLLDIIEAESLSLPEDAVVIETGGMKTHRREVARVDLHRRLASGFGVSIGQVYSEYGMCELLSQFYTRGGTSNQVGEVFYPPPWVRFDVRRTGDPLACSADPGEVGLLAIADLANVYTCSAILTNDLAQREGSGVRILGRAPSAELRGCNFLIEESLDARNR